jgi:hypothetical protein
VGSELFIRHSHRGFSPQNTRALMRVA